MCVQAFLSEAAVARLDLGVIRWPPWSREIQFDAVLVGSFVHGFRDEFTTVVDLDRLGQPARHTKLLKHTHHILSP